MSEQVVIPPTIGRVVWYFAPQDGALVCHNPQTPFDAHVVYVWSDTCINIAGYDHNGNPFQRTSVPINQTSGAQAWCEWMPYQQGQAKKAAS